MEYCGKEGIIFNFDKLKIIEKEVDIFGYKMTQKGIVPSDNQIEAITEFRIPSYIRDVQAFFGLINQSTLCLSGKTRAVMAELRGKLSTQVKWVWEEKIPRILQN